MKGRMMGYGGGACSKHIIYLLENGLMWPGLIKRSKRETTLGGGALQRAGSRVGEGRNLDMKAEGGVMYSQHLEASLQLCHLRYSNNRDSSHV